MNQWSALRGVRSELGVRDHPGTGPAAEGWRRGRAAVRSVRLGACSVGYVVDGNIVELPVVFEVDEGGLAT